MQNTDCPVVLYVSIITRTGVFGLHGRSGIYMLNWGEKMNKMYTKNDTENSEAYQGKDDTECSEK